MAVPKIQILDTALGDRLVDGPAIAAQLSETPSALVGASVQVDTGTRTATATTGSATLNKGSGIITTESLSTATTATYTLTLSNSTIKGTEIVQTSIQNGSNTGGVPQILTTAVGNGTITVAVKNAGASTFNGTLKIAFVSFE